MTNQEKFERWWGIAYPTFGFPETGEELKKWCEFTAIAHLEIGRRERTREIWAALAWPKWMKKVYPECFEEE